MQLLLKTGARLHGIVLALRRPTAKNKFSSRRTMGSIRKMPKNAEPDW
jgi:hypothetical protein